jgi:nucleotide-binding universal stress UspA family protein
MLDKALGDSDPETTDVVVMTAKVELPGADLSAAQSMDPYDQQLLTAVVDHAERLGKAVIPLLVPTNNALHAVLKTAKDLPAQEVLLGASNKYTAEEQLDQIALYWINLHSGEPQGLTVHIVSQARDLTFDLNGGNRIPKAAERQARSVAELRAAGLGVRRVLLAHDGTPDSSDVFEWLLTMLSTGVHLDIVRVSPLDPIGMKGTDTLSKDRQWGEQLGRTLNLLAEEPQSGPEIVRMSVEGNYDAIQLPMPSATWPLSDAKCDDWLSYVLRHAACSVFIAVHPAIPRQVDN